ncbi:MAG TPA: hypothetical protein VFT82_01050 [Candidatus Paceibacterota bacterium]|nr:hypothetical protein [Candidatus Paceibacterota bacterium]
MNQIMKKVRMIFLMRRLAAPFVFLVAASVVVASTVSVSHVIANMPALLDIPAVMRFFAAAFAHTDVVVKCALVAGTLFLVVTLKGVVDSFKFSASLQRI